MVLYLYQPRVKILKPLLKFKEYLLNYKYSSQSL